MDWLTVALGVLLLGLGIALLMGRVLTARVKNKLRRQLIGAYLILIAVLTFLLVVINTDLMGTVYKVVVVVLTTVMMVLIRLDLRPKSN